MKRSLFPDLEEETGHQYDREYPGEGDQVAIPDAVVRNVPSAGQDGPHCVGNESQRKAVAERPQVVGHRFRGPYDA